MAKVHLAHVPSGLFCFDCPGCEHVHSIQTKAWGGRASWEFNGDVDSPTFTPSLLNTTASTRCHLYVTAGEIQYQLDCTHAYAGRTVPVPDWDHPDWADCPD